MPASSFNNGDLLSVIRGVLNGNATLTTTNETDIATNTAAIAAINAAVVTSVNGVAGPGAVVVNAEAINFGTPLGGSFTATEVRAAILEAAGMGAVTSVNGATGVVALTLDNIPDTATYVRYTPAEQTKLAGIEVGATADQVAADVPFTVQATTGLTIAATNVQVAGNELDTRALALEQPTLVQSVYAAPGTFNVGGNSIGFFAFDSTPVNTGLGGTPDVTLAAGVFTVNRAGIYRITYGCVTDAGGSNQIGVYYIAKNGAGLGGFVADGESGTVAFAIASNFESASHSCLHAFAVGDTFTLFYQTVGAQTHTVYETPAVLTLQRLSA